MRSRKEIIWGWSCEWAEMSCKKLCFANSYATAKFPLLICRRIVWYISAHYRLRAFNARTVSSIEGVMANFTLGTNSMIFSTRIT